MDFFYAQLNEDNICIGVSQLSGEVKAGSMIRIDDCDQSLIGKKYEDGRFIKIETNSDGIEPEQFQQEPTNAEIAQMTMAVIEAVIDVSERLERWEEKQ